MAHNLPGKRYRIVPAVQNLADREKAGAWMGRYVSPDGPPYDGGQTLVRDLDQAFRLWRTRTPDSFPEREAVIRDFIRKWGDGDIVALRLGADGAVEAVDPDQLEFLNGIDWDQSRIKILSSEIDVVFCSRAEFQRWQSKSRPTSGAQTKCEQWLSEQISAFVKDGTLRKAKTNWKTEAHGRFSGLSARAFERAWGNVAQSHPEMARAGKKRKT